MKRENEEVYWHGGEIRRLFLDLTSGCKTAKEFDEKLERLKNRIDEMLAKQ
jgi:hypothetical protein